MLYVAIIQATNRAILASWHSGAAHRNYKSPVESDRKEAEKWLEENLKKYPKEEYLVNYGIIAFDEKESTNAEKMLEKLMHVF